MAPLYLFVYWNMPRRDALIPERLRGYLSDSLRYAAISSGARWELDTPHIKALLNLLSLIAVI